ncbi:MAG: SGNH/GDSL hydrolase family protein [Bacteroidaceae bacterium]|nr:SGNH/GDSL hydrolase family protein [Bacteroidaceae bacterium]
MRKILFLAIVIAANLFTAYAQKVSILGDSYSTYGGHVSPHWNYCWYNGNDKHKNQKNDVESLEQTWWSILIKEKGYTLEKNNSFSGSTVCYTGYRKEDYSDRAFITRMCNLGNPDIIFIFGGTNDSWAGSPIGYYEFNSWTRQQLYSFRPAFCYMISYIKQNYPNARIYNICNSELSKEVTETEAKVCEYYGVTNIQLKDIEKQSGHPSIKGMESIALQVGEVLK